MSVSYPFQVSEQDVERSSTLDKSDIGRWALLINGSYQFYASYDAAAQSRKHITKP